LPYSVCRKVIWVFGTVSSASASIGMIGPTLEALDQIISARCAALASEREKIRGQAGFPWWPKIASPRRSPGNRISLPPHA
jgi:hypothetical protein